MKYAIVILAIMMVGCKSVPVSPKWPAVPQDLKESCANLKLVPQDTTKLSVVVETVVDNYALFHECSIKVEGWTEWYEEQRTIYQELK